MLTMSNSTDDGKSGEQIVDFASLGPDKQELIKAAIEVRKRAYCPYSGFAVGAAIRSKKNGEIFTGCNVENGAYSPSICAERAAIGKAVSEGHREFSAMAVVAFQKDYFTAPCGVCRQTISEFAQNDIPIYISKPAPCRVLLTSIRTLLPHAFVPILPNCNGSNQKNNNLDFTAVSR